MFSRFEFLLVLVFYAIFRLTDFTSHLRKWVQVIKPKVLKRSSGTKVLQILSVQFTKTVDAEIHGLKENIRMFVLIGELVTNFCVNGSSLIKAMLANTEASLWTFFVSRACFRIARTRQYIKCFSCCSEVLFSNIGF